MLRVLPANASAKMSSVLKLSGDKIDYTLTPGDLEDFRVPLPIMRKNPLPFRNFSAPLQDLLLRAMGVKLDGCESDSLISWSVFVRINCLLRYDTMKKSE